MIHTIKKIGASVLVVMVMALTLSSCYETHYYHHYNHHTREWYGRHNTPAPANVNFDVDVRHW